MDLADKLACAEILERTANFERDRLDPVVPSDAFARLKQTADVEKFPEPYRYMAFHLTAARRPLALPIHYDGAPHTREFYALYEARLGATAGDDRRFKPSRSGR